MSAVRCFLLQTDFRKKKKNISESGYDDNDSDDDDDNDDDNDEWKNKNASSRKLSCLSSEASTASTILLLPKTSEPKKIVSFDPNCFRIFKFQISWDVKFCSKKIQIRNKNISTASFRKLFLVAVVAQWSTSLPLQQSFEFKSHEIQKDKTQDQKLFLCFCSQDF